MVKTPIWLFPCVGSVAVGATVIAILVGASERVAVPRTDKSMRPTLGDATEVAVTPRGSACPERDAMVAFLAPGAGVSVARVAAVAGDRLEVRERRIHVNGRLVSWSARTSVQCDVGEVVLPRGTVFVLVEGVAGTDSLDVGPLPLWRVRGTVSK